MSEHGLTDNEIDDVLTGVSDALDGILSRGQRRPGGGGEPVQVSSRIDDEDGCRGVAVRIVDRGTIAIARGTVSASVEYGRVLVQSAMGQISTRADPNGGTVITMRTRPLAEADGRAAGR